MFLKVRNHFYFNFITSLVPSSTTHSFQIKTSESNKNQKEKSYQRKRPSKNSMATRSPSPTPSRPRTPDANNPLRKSRDSLKANSASKSSTTQRPSISEYKENEKKKPLIPNSKVPRNFMAPTISAASKFTPLPSRRKILQERNEVLNPVSKSLEFDSANFEFGTKSEMGFVNQHISKSFEAKSEDLETKTHKKTSPLPQLASLDADPTLPPYDPKTNYLSPRPQFLHYKPNPRIEHYFTDVIDGKSLDDSFSSDSSDVDYEKEQELESESSDESFHSEVEKIESDELEFNSQCENATESSNCENESKKSIKVPSFRRLGLISFLLIIISLAFINVPLSDTPIMPSYPFIPNEYFVNMTQSVVDEPASVSLSYLREIELKQEFKESDLELPQEIEPENLYTEIETQESVNDDTSMDDELEIEVKESEYAKEAVEKEAFEFKNELEIEVIGSKNVEEEVEKEIFDSLYANVMKLENEHEAQHYETPLEVENEVQNYEILTENAKEEQINEETLDTAYTEEVEDTEMEVEYATAAMNTVIVYGSLLLAVLAFAAACLVFKGKQRASVQNANQNVTSESSEMSYSFDNTGRSQEKGRRRDSTASSSSSFVSYGSYTTYERISAKKGNREEEMVTPVRRSSRIKQLTSP